MKTLSRMLIALLVIAMSLSVASCEKKMIGVDDFTRIMEDKLKCVVLTPDKYDNQEEYLIATNADVGYRIEYMINTTEQGAEDYFDRNLKSLEDGIEDEEDYLEGTVKKTGSGNYKKFVFKGQFVIDGNVGEEIYMIMVRFDNMIIIASAKDTSEKTTKEVDKAIKALGY